MTGFLDGRSPVLFFSWISTPWGIVRHTKDPKSTLNDWLDIPGEVSSVKTPPYRVLWGECFAPFAGSHGRYVLPLSLFIKQSHWKVFVYSKHHAICRELILREARAQIQMWVFKEAGINSSDGGHSASSSFSCLFLGSLTPPIRGLEQSFSWLCLTLQWHILVPFGYTWGKQKVTWY